MVIVTLGMIKHQNVRKPSRTYGPQPRGHSEGGETVSGLTWFKSGASDKGLGSQVLLNHSSAKTCFLGVTQSSNQTGHQGKEAALPDGREKPKTQRHTCVDNKTIPPTSFHLPTGSPLPLRRTLMACHLQVQILMPFSFNLKFSFVFEILMNLILW